MTGYVADLSWKSKVDYGSECVNISAKILQTAEHALHKRDFLLKPRNILHQITTK